MNRRVKKEPPDMLAPGEELEGDHPVLMMREGTVSSPSSPGRELERAAKRVLWKNGHVHVRHLAPPSSSFDSVTFKLVCGSSE